MAETKTREVTGVDPAQWMALLQQGDEEALERLLTHYDGMLRYIAGGILDHPQELEDCLAQVRLKLWESRGQYDPERSSPATWLTALCRSAAVDRLRKAKRQNTGELPETHPDPAPGPEEQLLQKEPGTGIWSTGNTTTSSPPPGWPPSWASPSGRWRAVYTASAENSRSSWEVKSCESQRI